MNRVEIVERVVSNIAASETLENDKKGMGYIVKGILNAAGFFDLLEAAEKAHEFMGDINFAVLTKDEARNLTDLYLKLDEAIRKAGGGE